MGVRQADDGDDPAGPGLAAPPLPRRCDGVDTAADKAVDTTVVSSLPTRRAGPEPARARPPTAVEPKPAPGLRGRGGSETDNYQRHQAPKAAAAAAAAAGGWGEGGEGV